MTVNIYGPSVYRRISTVNYDWVVIRRYGGFVIINMDFGVAIGVPW